MNNTVDLFDNINIDSGSVLISFATYPNGKAFEFINKVEKNIEHYKQGRAKYFIDVENYNESEPINPENLSDINENKQKNNFHFYHNPAMYHIFGKYDVAFISLIDNLAISNKLFLPTRLSSEDKPGNSKTHVISGLPIRKSSSDVEDKFSRILGYSGGSAQQNFFCCCNIKLNNSFLLGNGYIFINEVVSIIEKELEDTLFVILNSLGNYELTVLLFGEDINLLNQKILNLRKLTLVKIRAEIKDEIIKRSVFSWRQKFDTSIGNADESHIISNTQSYYGVKLVKKGQKKYDWAVKNFEGFKSLIEWEIKPGHDKYIDTYLKGKFDEKNFIAGRTDFLYILNESNNLKHNHEIFYNLHYKKSINRVFLHKHVRRLKTKLLFSDTFESFKIKDSNDHRIPVCDQFLKSEKQLLELTDALKKIKVSSELRTRIVKIFLNFNAVLQNSLVYHQFIDLYYFLDRIYTLILEYAKSVDKFYECNLFDKNLLSVYDLESKLTEIIKMYKDSFGIRYSNNYLVEDSTEGYHLEYNSSVQLLISSLDNYFKILYSDIDNNENSRQIITRVNGLDTTATNTGVDFCIYNLFEPGVLFYVSTKEIYVIKFKGDEKAKVMKIFQNDCEKFWDKYFLENPYSSCIHMRDHIKNEDHQYYLIDLLRFEKYFERDFKFFVYCHLYVYVQHPAMYSISGKNDYDQFFKEFRRLLFIALYCDKVSDNPESRENQLWLKANCPLPYLSYLWNKSYDELIDPMTIFCEYFPNTLSKQAESENSKTKYQKIISHYTDNLDIKKENIPSLSQIQVPNFRPDLSSIFSNGPLKENYFIDWFQQGEFKVFSKELTIQYLKFIYNSNGQINSSVKVSKANRDWTTGKLIPISEYDKEENEDYYNQCFFLNDPNGGAFFHSFEKLKEFSHIRNKVLILLFHQNYLFKKVILETHKI